MSNWSRRSFLKSGLAASAGAITPISPGQPVQNAIGADMERKSTDIIEISHRERLLMDFGWRFSLGNADDSAKDFWFGATAREGTFAKANAVAHPSEANFDDSGWTSIDLPHDWAVDLPFVNGIELPAHGGKPLGRAYPETSIGWYRRVFEVPKSDLSRRIAIEFDGVFRNATVLLNGHYIGKNFSGYAPVRYDLTDYVNYGSENFLAVRVDATLSEGWFYEGAGIYRHVWLTKTSLLHVKHWGVYARSEVSENSATVSIDTEVENESGGNAVCHVISEILDENGEVVATARSKHARLPAWGSYKFESLATVDNPRLWSIEDPHLYKVISRVESEGVAIDIEETTFGIRTFRFDAENGFFLNDKPVKIKGTCNHQDHAGVGVALPDRLQTYRLERLQAMGSNGCRTSHNPATPEFLDACDRMGMLVMEETRMMGSTPEALSQLERMIRRDRNRPCIVIWSLANEEPEQGTPRGARIVASMKKLVRQLDPTRPVTAAMNGGWGRGGVSDVVDVQGCNYNEGNIDKFHRDYPSKPMIGTETSSQISTRGTYRRDAAACFVSAYDVNAPVYAKTAEAWWKFYDSRRFLAGGFAWTGFDYRGEPAPFGWPCVSSQFGVIDLCGYPKDTYFYYQAWWGSKPVLHLFPHWNWSGMEGQEIEVWCHSNLDSVELFLNGQSLGSRRIERNTHLEWKVKYAPGLLEARGTKNGQVILVDKRETTGHPARIVLHPDRQRIAADGEDLSVIRIEVLDSLGRVVPTASEEINFKLTGAGHLIGMGNGYPGSHELGRPTSPGTGKCKTFNGLCMALVQSHQQVGEIRVEASSIGLADAAIVIQAEATKLRPLSASAKKYRTKELGQSEGDV